MHSFHVHYVPTMCHKLCKELGKLVTKGSFCNQELTFQLQTQSHSDHPVKGTECQHACILLTFLMKYHHVRGEWKVSRLVGRRNKRLMRYTSKHQIIPRALVTSSSCNMRIWIRTRNTVAYASFKCCRLWKCMLFSSKIQTKIPPSMQKKMQYVGISMLGAEIRIGGECIIVDRLSSE